MAMMESQIEEAVNALAAAEGDKTDPEKLEALGK